MARILFPAIQCLDLLIYTDHNHRDFANLTNKNKKPASGSAHSRLPFDGTGRDIGISNCMGTPLWHSLPHLRLCISDLVVWRESAQKYLGENRIRHILFVCGKRDPIHQISSGLLSQRSAIVFIPCGMRSICIIDIDQTSIQV